MGRADEQLEAMLDETRKLRASLQHFVNRQAAILEAEIFEEFTGQTPPTGGGVVIDTFAAQTNSLEIITGVLVIVPIGTTAATFTLGERDIPVQDTSMLLAPCQFKTMNQTRKLVYTAPANATLRAYICCWGFIGRSQAPGRLG